MPHLTHADRALPLVLAPATQCPRKLPPGWVKRYLHAPRPLVGYMVACPGCGFIELHMQEKAAFVEVDGALASATGELRCMVCGRDIAIDDGLISARARVP